MTKKLSKFKYHTLSIITLTILTIISFYYFNKRDNLPLPTEEEEFNFIIDGKSYIMPTAFHSFHYLNSLNFQWKNLAEMNTNINSTNESQTALLLGFRAADGVIFLFANEKESARKVRNSVIELAKNLDIITDIKSEISSLDNAVILNADEDILEDRIIDLQYKIQNALHKKQKDNLAALVELGGWLEGLHITCKGIILNYNSDHSEILKQSHVSKIYIDIVNALIKKHSNDKEKLILENVLSNLIKISKITNHSHTEAFPLEKVKELYKISSDVKKIIESNDDNPNK